MKRKWMQLLATLVLLGGAGWAQAAITCTAPVATGFSTAYASAGVVPNVTQGSVDVTCTRTLASDSTVVYLRANNTNQCGGGGNTEARFGGSCITYEGYRDSACTTIWTNAAAGAIPLTFSTVGTQTINVPVWGCITIAGQSPAAGAGTYTDSVPLQLRQTTSVGTTLASGNFPVSITYPASCVITSIAPVAFGTYVAFRSTPLSATSNVVLNCTSRLPYSMALNTTSGVLVGLNYSLALSATTSRGTGPGQTHTITGTMPANQAGTCATSSCSGTNVHTLTITY